MANRGLTAHELARKLLSAADVPVFTMERDFQEPNHITPMNVPVCGLLVYGKKDAVTLCDGTVLRGSVCVTLLATTEDGQVDHKVVSDNLRAQFGDPPPLYDDDEW